MKGAGKPQNITIFWYFVCRDQVKMHRRFRGS